MGCRLTLIASGIFGAFAFIRTQFGFILRSLGLDLVQDSVKLALLILRPINGWRIARSIRFRSPQFVRGLQMYLQNLHDIAWTEIPDKIPTLKILDGLVVGASHKLAEAAPDKLYLTSLAGGLLLDRLLHARFANNIQMVIMSPRPLGPGVVVRPSKEVGRLAPRVG